MLKTMQKELDRLEKRQKEKQRREEITKLWKTGMSQQEIAQKFNISYQRVGAIIRKVKRDNILYNNVDFMVVLKHCDGDDYIARRIYHILNTQNIVTEVNNFREYVTNINLEKIQEIRGLGPKSFEIVSKIQEYYKNECV